MALIIKEKNKMNQEQVQQQVPVPEKIIDVARYQLDDEHVLTTYTGKWCGPCTRIKEKGLTNFLETKKLIEESEIVKSEFKKTINDFIPFFELRNTVENSSKTIQTSDFDLLMDFLKNKRLVINFDF
jgi:hypothetical protein